MAKDRESQVENAFVTTDAELPPCEAFTYQFTASDSFIPL